MSILDKLVEKKDLESYLGLRAAYLRDEMKKEILKQPESKRELIMNVLKVELLNWKTQFRSLNQTTLKESQNGITN